MNGFFNILFSPWLLFAVIAFAMLVLVGVSVVSFIRQKGKEKFLEQLKKMLAPFLILAVATLLLTLVIARVISFGIDNNSSNIFMGVSGNAASLPAAFLEPLKIYWADKRVQTGAAIVVGVMLLLAAATFSRGMKLKKEDTQDAHAQDRLATTKEARKFLDEKCEFNNLMFSENCGIVLNPYDARTKDKQNEKNLNSITLGISGLGKTFNGVYPQLMEAAGCALVPYPYGRKGAKENYYKLPKAGKGKNAKDMSFVGQGFDVFITDTKGDSLADCGKMLVEAGFDIRVFNTIDLLNGQNYNPLSTKYIPTHLVDVVDVSDVSASIQCQTTVKPTANPDSWKTLEVGTSSAQPLVNAAAIGWRKNDFKLAASLQLETEMTSLENEANTESLINDVKVTKYQRSHGHLTVNVQNLSAHTISQRIVVELDPALVADGAQSTTDEQAKLEFNEDKNCWCVIWETGNLEPVPREGKCAAEMSWQVLDISVHIKHMTVPDGVALTKIVDTMCANLSTSTSESVGSGDQEFWESCKRLFFMGIISYMFERFDERDVHIPNMIRLLDMAIPERGAKDDTKTALGTLMAEWESGKRTETFEVENERGITIKEKTTKLEHGAHSRSISLALHCFYAIEGGAEDTFRSVLVSCQSALKNLVSLEIQEKLKRDDMDLQLLGTPGQKSAIFCIIKDLDNPLEFVTALMVQQAIDLAQDRAYKKFSGKLPRHTRFILDEVANIGKVPVLVRALAVVRSRNISIGLMFQSKAQLAKVYGDKEASICFDNCSTLVFLGAQDKDTLKMMSDLVGEETVFSRTFQRSFNSAGTQGGLSENITSNKRAIMSVSQVRSLERGHLLIQMAGLPGTVFDRKIQTTKHPLFAYICPGEREDRKCPACRYKEHFDLTQYLRQKKFGEVRV